MLAGVALVQVFPALPPRWLALAALLPAPGCTHGGWRRAAGAFLLGSPGPAPAARRRWRNACRPRFGHATSRRGRVLGLPRRDEDGQRFDFLVESGPRARRSAPRARGLVRAGRADGGGGSRWRCCCA
jgi:hypothetical protein